MAEGGGRAGNEGGMDTGRVSVGMGEGDGVVKSGWVLVVQWL